MGPGVPKLIEFKEASFTFGDASRDLIRVLQERPMLGAHAHPYPWVLGGHGCDVIVHGWAWVGIVLCILASNFKSESNFLDARNTLTKKCSGLKPATVNDLLFVQSNQDLV